MTTEGRKGSAIALAGSCVVKALVDLETEYRQRNVKDLTKKRKSVEFLSWTEREVIPIWKPDFQAPKGFAKRFAEGDADPCSKQRSETPNISASGKFLVTKPNQDKKSGPRN